jgi:hypothetical protein
VTRLGEFLLFGRLFSLGAGFFEITKVTRFVGYFFTRAKLCINFDKNELGYIFGDFFANSSGDPVLIAQLSVNFMDELLETEFPRKCC